MLVDISISVLIYKLESFILESFLLPTPEVLTPVNPKSSSFFPVLLFTAILLGLAPVKLELLPVPIFEVLVPVIPLFNAVFP